MNSLTLLSVTFLISFHSFLLSPRRRETHYTTISTPGEMFEKDLTSVIILESSSERAFLAAFSIGIAASRTNEHSSAMA